MGFNERQRYRVGGPRRRITEGADEIRDRTIRRRALHRDVFPADVTGTSSDVKAPGFHEVAEQQAHEQGSPGDGVGVAAEDHNHDFTYAGLEEARSVATADATYTDPHEAVAEGINPFVAPGLFHMRTVSWAIKEGFEERYPTCPIDVFVRYDPLGGTAWGEWHKVAVVPPGTTQAFYETLENFDPNKGTVATVDVKVLPRVRGDLSLRIVRTGSDGKVDVGFLPSGVRPLVYSDGSIPGGNQVVNTSLLTSFASSYTIPANRLRVGSVIRIRLAGLYGTDVAAPTFSFKILFNATTVLQIGAGLSLGALITDLSWFAEAEDIIVTTVGAGGAVEAHGTTAWATSSSTVTHFPMPTTAPVSIDTTIPQLITAAVQFGTADPDNKITLHTMTVDIVDLAS